MTKSELLAKTIGIITRCEHDIEEILTWDFLTEEERAGFYKQHAICKADRLALEKDGDQLGEAFLAQTYHTYYTDVYSKLRGFQNAKAAQKAEATGTPSTPVVEKEEEKVVPPTPTAVHVAEVKPEEEQEEEEKEATKKGKSWWKHLLATLGIAGLAVAITLLCKGCDKDIKNIETEPTKPTSSTEITLSDDELDKLRGIDNFDMDDVNLEDYSSLLEAAKKIQDAMPEDKKIPLEQIQYALVFGNLDQLEDEKQGKVFREAEEIYAATYNLGIMLDDLNVNADDLIAGTHPVLTEQELLASLVNVTDLKLTIEKFAGAKVEGGYDLYKVLEICGAGMDITDDEDLAFNYAATMNDIVAQVTRNFTMPSTATEEEWSYLYTTLGIYNANKDRILELTSGRHLSTIYGTGIRNDGSYGDICVEELLASSAIYHKNGTYTGPGKVKLYIDADGYEWPEGYVYEENGQYYTNFVTARDENGNVLQTEKIAVKYNREVDPSAFLARDGDYMNAICDINNKGIGR